MFPDGRRVVSGSYDNTLKVWDVATGECVATLEGHSDWRALRGVHCTFVMIWLRRRSGALPCFRTGGASFLGRTTRRSRCGTWRPANAWRRWKGTRTSVRCGVHCTFVMMCLRRRSMALPCFRTGGASCLRRRQDAQGLGRGDRQMRGDAGRALGLTCVAASAVLL